MLLLFETPAGYSLFKVKDEKKLGDVEVRGEATRAVVTSGVEFGRGGRDRRRGINSVASRDRARGRRRRVGGWVRWDDEIRARDGCRRGGGWDVG